MSDTPGTTRANSAATDAAAEMNAATTRRSDTLLWA